jgi:hypothetical protein
MEKARVGEGGSFPASPRPRVPASSVPASPFVPVPASFSPSPRPPFSPSSSFLSRFLLDWTFWLRPQIVTAVFALLLLTGLAYFSLRTDIARPTAPELLSQSIAAEDALAARTDLVLHRTFTLEEREPGGKTLTRQRIEVWHSAAKAVTARRLYDENGRLLSGEWTRAGIAGAIYRSHHAAREPQVEIRNPQSAIRSLEVWQLSPSAKDFTALIGSREATSFEERNSTYVISYEQPVSEAGGAGVVKATLTLSSVDLHASELTLLVASEPTDGTPRNRDDAQGGNRQSAIGNRQFLEYRFTESAFERRAPDTVAPSVFEPDSELLVPPAEPESRNPKPETPAPATGSESPAPVVATAELEVEVLRLLNEAGADMDDQTNVARTSDGRLVVSGVVETEGRRAEILRALAPVMSNPAVTMKVETVAEVLKRQKQSQSSSGPITVQRVEVTKSQFPVEEDVRRYLGKDEGQTGEEVRQFAARILNRSRLIMSEAGTLKRLAGQFSPEDLRNMSAEARAKWLGVSVLTLAVGNRKLESCGKSCSRYFPLVGRLARIPFRWKSKTTPVSLGPLCACLTWSQPTIV